MTDLMNHGLCRKAFRAALLASLLLLGSCDGGIFGTGDGSDIQDVETDNMPEGSDGGPIDQDQDSQTTDNVPTLAFDNLLNSGGEGQPTLRLTNLTARELNVRHSRNQSRPLYSTPVQAQQTGEAVPVLLGDNTLDVFDSNSAGTLFSLTPLNAGEASVTSLIARETHSNGFSLMALRTLTHSTMTEVALLRLIQVYPLDDADTRATFTLQPQGDAPGPAPISFPDRAASKAPDSAYATVGAGEYLLSDSLSRFDPVSIAVSAGEILTVLIVDRQTPVIALLRDSTQSTAP